MKAEVLQGRLRLTPEGEGDLDALDLAVGRGVGLGTVKREGEGVAWVEVSFGPDSEWIPIEEQEPPEGVDVLLFSALVDRLSGTDPLRPVFAPIARVGRWPEERRSTVGEEFARRWNEPTHWAPVPDWPDLPGPIPRDLGD